jgi:uncharacterized protein
MYMILKRWAQKSLELKLETHRIVSVVGCRQSGKTTLLLEAPIENRLFKSLDEEGTFLEAKTDPSFFVRRTVDTVMVIDEIQKVPSLIGEIKFAVDRNQQKGQYIISGSADYRKLPHANESLAGRAGFVRVRTLTEGEKRGRTPGFLKALFEGKLPLSLSFECSKPFIFECVLAGGFPEVRDFSNPKHRTSWFQDYLANQVLLDLRNQWGVRKKNTLEEVLFCTATLSSRPMVKARLASDFNLTWETLNTYLSAIEALYLVDMVPGWAKKDSDRPGISPKPFMTDTGLMAHLLKIYRPEDILNSNERSQNEGGKLFETWVYNQLASEFDLNPEWNLYYFRSRSHEIDFMASDERGHLVGIEVKASESISSEDFRHLHWMRELLGEENFTGIVLYAGDRVRSGGKGCFALPAAALWSDFSRWEALE